MLSPGTGVPGVIYRYYVRLHADGKHLIEEVKHLRTLPVRYCNTAHSAYMFYWVSYPNQLLACPVNWLYNMVSGSNPTS